MRANMYNYDDKLDEQDFEEMCEETNINYIQDLKNKIAILEKALDKVLLYLTIIKPKKSYDEWKEWALEESEKQ